MLANEQPTRDEWYKQSVGCTESELLQKIAINMRWYEQLDKLVVSMLSDCQEMVDRADHNNSPYKEMARQTLNQVKYILLEKEKIQEYLNSSKT